MAGVRPTGGHRGGVGLAAERLGHGPDVLVTTAADHVALRTPTRPDHVAGNALHLYAPPVAIRPWLARHARTVGAVPGVERASVGWEVADDLGGTDPRTAAPDDLPDDAEVALVRVLAWRPDLAGDPGARTAALADLDASARVRRADLDVRSGADDKVLSGARALYLQAGWGTDVAHWRWRTEQQLDLLVARRCDVWVAYVMGIPASRASLVHDRRGLALVTDVVTHPLHRGRGLASALVLHALGHHLADHPDHVVVARVVVDGTARRLAGHLGFTVVATDVVVDQPVRR